MGRNISVYGLSLWNSFIFSMEIFPHYMATLYKCPFHPVKMFYFLLNKKNVTLSWISCLTVFVRIENYLNRKDEQIITSKN